MAEVAIDCVGVSGSRGGIGGMVSISMGRVSW
jgi:hypothetical protein